MSRFSAQVQVVVGGSVLTGLRYLGVCWCPTYPFTCLEVSNWQLRARPVPHALKCSLSVQALLAHGGSVFEVAAGLEKR